MSDGAGLNILVSLTDNASAGMAKIAATSNTAMTNTANTTKTAEKEAAGLGSTVGKQSWAFREMARGVGFMGLQFAAMGVMLKSTNTELGNVAGNTLMVVGSMMSAVSVTVQFISSIGKITKALQSLAAAEMLVKAFSSPWGIVGVAAGVGALAVGTVAGINAMNRSEKRAETKITINNAGSVVSDKQLVDQIHKGLLLKQQQNFSLGLNK